ncbi:hypothetical protein [Azospirillum aestuarii]|uniref:hypothetical protein n=1 Tax=Azospirillum aestuarii TaxID=2802052 RepID=UPI0040551025
MLTKAHLAHNVVDFVNDWCWTYDPREIGKAKSPFMPFDLFPKQVEFLWWLQECVENGDEWLVEKCRDAGASYLTVAFCVHRWLFHDAFKATFGSRVEDAVDKAGDPDSIFEKARIILKRLPLWMLPPGFDERRHSLYMRLINPANGSVISGQGGKNMGRGGRSSIYIVDEGAHIDQAEKVEAAIIGNADCRGWVSSVNGMGNLFYRKRQNDSVKVFTFRLEDDPRKTPEWIARKKASTDPVTWAQEYELDYGASAEGVCIPGPWVQAAVKLGKLLGDRLARWTTPTAPGVAGMDVGGGGKGKTVLVVRKGPVVRVPKSWNTPDNITTTHAALDEMREAGAGVMNYDPIGVGNTVTSTLKHANTDGLKVYPINVGDSPSDAEWPDGRKAKEMFANLKAELWWTVRCAFQRSYELLLFLEGQEGGCDHPLEDIIVLPDSKELTGQLPVPKWLKNEKGRIGIESKLSLARRGIPSPDFAEALVLTYAPEPIEDFVMPSVTPVFGGRGAGLLS